MPSHNHRISISGSASSASAGAHHHGTYGEAGTGPWGNYLGSPGNRAGIDGRDGDNNWYNTSTNGAHTHSFSFNFNGSSASTGSGSSFSIQNPYYALIYCVKCK